MTPDQKASYVFAQAVCALARIEYMKAENAQRANQGQSVAYLEAFNNVAKLWGITSDQILSFFEEPTSDH